ncbi:MAG: ATP-binding cassette domain-containing protein [Bacteroidota bacterium]|nr:ATP-binding cassette domain-containing protein [Bacteroidota bacterium]
MYQVSLNNIGKKYNREWIFRNLNYEILANDTLVLLGGNGSGKSTLLQIISGFISPNEGELVFSQKLKDADQQSSIINPKLISFASPYIQLIEDFTLIETIEHSALFKPFKNKLTTHQLIEIIELSHAKTKFIKQFSSGMKQRLKLGLAILAETPFLILDEPVSNLDKNAIEWYKNLITTYSENRTIIVASNAIADEYFFCAKALNVMDFKK